MAGICTTGTFSKAEASVIPYSVIGVHEFDLPVKYDPFNVILSYNIYNDDRNAWGGPSGGQDSLLTINKFAHFFKVDALPNVGFLWELVLGGASVRLKNDDSVSGMIDPQVGIVSWIRPLPNWTTALEYWLYVPFGDNEISNHAIDNSVAFLTNYTLGGLTFDGDFGIKLRGDSHYNGVKQERGDLLFGNLSLAYKFIPNVEPFVKLDWVSAGKGKDLGSGATVASSDETAIGIGNHFSLTQKLAADVWYLRGVDGRNNTKTDAVYLKFAYIF
ncbi:transporter [Geomonas sp. RF6]|uniref:transporter n=1 Tax=Geomonas sp. RF6 TaxID=2897342 RepID=UPI001E36C43A|nr:transporter [Geomonas sp. RF6]UFS70686.1 transporter [Geomonas sp. RF6]